MSLSRSAFPTEASPVCAAWAEIAWGSAFPFPCGFDDILISFFLLIGLPLSVLRLLFSCRISCTLSDSAVRNQHHAEPCFALHHASVSIGSLFERKCLDHRTDIFQDTEGKSVLAINQRTRHAPVNRTPAKHDRERIQLNSF